MPEPVKTKKSEYNCGDKCFVMIDGKITETFVRARDVHERFNEDAKRTDKAVEYYVKGLERECKLAEMFESVETLVDASKDSVV